MRASGGPVLIWTLEAGAGHDDQLLVEPERRGVVEPVDSEFGNFGSGFEARWSAVPILGRATLFGGATATRYNSTEVGNDHELRLSGSARRPLRRSLILDLGADFLRFRREDLDDFNVNLGHGSARLAWAPSGRWLASAAVRHTWISFPDRILYPDTSGVGGDGDIIVTPVGPEPEEDRQLDFAVSVLRRVGQGGFLVVEAAHRRAASNEELVEYTGPAFTLKAGSRLPGGSEFSAFTSFTRRSFDSAYPVLVEGKRAWTEATRTDESWQFGFALERPLQDRTRLFATGSWLSQDSSIDDFTFDHARFTVGVRMDLWSSGDPRRRLPLPMGEPELAPRTTPRGVRFSYRSQEAAAVHLVGDFNGWDPASTPLEEGERGLWEVTLPLAAGIWRYTFVVDGRWVRPPDAPRYEPDGFGGENGVLETLGLPEGEPHPVTQESDTRPTTDDADDRTPGVSAFTEAEWKTEKES